jgi:hypothetical protein
VRDIGTEAPKLFDMHQQLTPDQFLIRFRQSRDLGDGFFQSLCHGEHSITSPAFGAARELCAGAGANDPNPVCVTKTELAALLGAAATPAASISVSSSPSNPRDASQQNPSSDLTNSGNPNNANPSSPADSSSTPVIQINGENPAHVSVGSTYQDLGATISGTQADLNLGIKNFLNGALVSDIVLDTSAAATDTVQYVVTDPTGLTATSTRTILIEPPATPSVEATSSLPLIDSAPPRVPDYPATTTVR